MCFVGSHGVFRSNPTTSAPRGLPMPCSLVSSSGHGTGREVLPNPRAHPLIGTYFQKSWLQPGGWGAHGDTSEPWLLLTPSIPSSQSWCFSRGWVFFQLFEASGPSFSNLCPLPEPCACAADSGTGRLCLVGHQLLPVGWTGGAEAASSGKSHRRNACSGGGSVVSLFGSCTVRDFIDTGKPRGEREKVNVKQITKWRKKREIFYFFMWILVFVAFNSPKFWKIGQLHSVQSHSFCEV